ncbi:hypothetical protein K492DRAFT_207547 [Lichtheimia hyalospora FSU 10163]|nr:hypothetical protein K492DRAFT_207547 [Lichtheimia hyalospora FSU 10163]
MLRCNRLNTANTLANTTTTTSHASSTTNETAAAAVTDFVFNDSDISLSLAIDDCCCGQNDCPVLQSWTRTVQKLETDARLAAEIGQSLLQKHDKYVFETDKLKKDLHNKAHQYRERIRDLEQAVQVSDTAKQELHQDKNKWYWKWKRTQSTLDATAADLEIANNRCTQLSNELRRKELEIEKLQLFQIESREAHGREEILRAKLDDIQQEVNTLRKNDKASQSRMRAMKDKHASLTRTYETLKASVETRNAKSSRLLNQATTVSHTKFNERKMSWNDLSTLSNELPPPHELMPSLSTPAMPVSAMASVPEEASSESTTADSEEDNASSIQHHHHYHYILETKTMNQELNHNSALSFEKHLMDLHDAAKDKFERLRDTEALKLSRQAKSVFDMPQMGKFSNAMIEHILADMDRQFATTVPPGCNSLLPTSQLYQELLKEIGELRTNLNDLKIDYVKRLKEKYMLQRQQQEAKCLQQEQKRQQQSSSILSGILASLFQRPIENSREHPQQQQKRLPSSSRKQLHPPQPRFHSRSTSTLSGHQQHRRVVGISNTRASAPELDLDMKVRGSLSTSLFVGW